MTMTRSAQAFAEAQRYLPGGVDSPVRAFRAVGGTPPFIDRAAGAYLYDLDGNGYIDYVGSWGPLIAGHAHPEVVARLHAAVDRGTSYGAPTEAETELARRVVEMVPSIEMVRFVNSGTEATMAALRLARAATGRSKVVKFAGCYHGHADAFLVKAGSGAATFGVPDSPGVTETTARDTLTARFNDAGSVRELFAAHPGEIAAVIVEPVVGNMGVVPPDWGFLQDLRELCDAEDALLIFDEVMTGFRVAFGGAQERYNVRPDLTTLGKIIGGGLPVGAYGGRRDLMEMVAPAGPVYQAGTMSGNPIAMAAGLATLRVIEEDGALYDRLERLGAALEWGIGEAINRTGVPCTFARVGSMWTLFFVPERVTSWDVAARADRQRYARFFHAMLDRGIALAPSQFEANFLSAAHGSDDIDRTVAAVSEALQEQAA